MRTSSIGALLLLGLVLAIFLVGLRNRKAGKELVSYLRAAGFVTSPCPIAQAFTYTDMIRLDCYRGELRSGVTAYVLLAQRRGTSVMVNGVPMATFEDYIGLYVAPLTASTLDDAWRQRWQADLNTRGATPLRVVKTPEGGVLLNWRSTHDKSTLEARLAAVRKVLP